MSEISEGRVRACLQTVFRVRLVGAEESPADAEANANLLNLEETNELISEPESGSPLEYEEVIGNALMEVMTKMSAGVFPPGLKKKADPNMKHTRIRYLCEAYESLEKASIQYKRVRS